MLLYLILILFCLFALSDWFSREARLMRKIPGPKAWPIIGNVMSLVLFNLKWDTGKRSYAMNPWRTYGHLNQIHAMNMRMVIITNPEDTEVFFSTNYSMNSTSNLWVALKILSSPQHMTKSKHYKLASSWLGDGLPLSTGAKWRQRRKMLSKSFHFNVLKNFMVTFNEETEEFLKQVEEETANEQTNLEDLVKHSVLRIIYETIVGISLRENKDAYDKYLNSIHTLCDCLVTRFYKVWLHHDFLFNLSGTAKIQKAALEHFHGLTNKVINDRREFLKKTNFILTDHDSISYDKNKKLSLLDLLLENESSGKINDEGIREEVNNFIIAAFDTTTATLSSFLMAIANETAVQNKIYEEQQQIFGDSPRSAMFEDVNEMKYLECCIKESLRLYPSGINLGRNLSEDTILSGHTVPAGTTCHIFISELHRRADLYPDPERFDPDRFLPEHCRDRHPYSYVPFSAGLRNCIGQKYAMLNMKTLLSGLFRKFRVEPVTRPSDLTYVSDIILRSKHPLYARFRLRN